MQKTEPLRLRRPVTEGKRLFENGVERALPVRSAVGVPHKRNTHFGEPCLRFRRRMDIHQTRELFFAHHAVFQCPYARGGIHICICLIVQCHISYYLSLEFRSRTHVGRSRNRIFASCGSSSSRRPARIMEKEQLVSMSPQSRISPPSIGAVFSETRTRSNRPQ